MSKVTVLYIRSLAYSGSTWMNLVLAGHPDAFALGIPDVALRYGPGQGDWTCSVHQRSCDFWPRFIDDWDREGNFILQLAERCQKRVIVLNNPSLDFHRAHLSHPDVDCRVLRVMRDGRANVTSAIRHTPDLFDSRYHAMRTWLTPAWEHLLGVPAPEEGRDMVLRYEDLVLDPVETLGRVGAFAGLDYPKNAVRFWEFDHHFVNGNTGAIGLLKDLKGIPRKKHKREAHYRELLDYTRRNPDTPRLDESWRSFLTREDRMVYDWLMGDRHEAFGYDRDDFDPEEVLAHIGALGLPDDPARAPESLGEDGTIARPGRLEQLKGKALGLWKKVRG